jgi:hypothetical protein
MYGTCSCRSRNLRPTYRPKHQRSMWIRTRTNEMPETSSSIRSYLAYITAATIQYTKERKIDERVLLRSNHHVSRDKDEILFALLRDSFLNLCYSRPPLRTGQASGVRFEVLGIPVSCVSSQHLYLSQFLHFRIHGNLFSVFMTHLFHRFAHRRAA